MLFFLIKDVHKRKEFMLFFLTTDVHKKKDQKFSN